MTDTTVQNQSIPQTPPEQPAGLWGKVKHAFAVDAASKEPLTEQQEKLIEQISQEVVRRNMVIPAITFLEMSRPLNFLGSQMMHVMNPFVKIMASMVSREATSYDQLTQLLERRDSIDLICNKLEELNEQKKTKQAAKQI